MCFDADALPPVVPADLVLPALGGGAKAEQITLTSHDGTQFAAAVAPTAEPKNAAVVILPDVRGLYGFYVDLAERFASAGHHAIAIDYFGRTAGVAERDDEFDFWPHVKQTTIPGVQADAGAAIEHLYSEFSPGAIVTLGFCFGGTHSFLAGASDLPLDAVVGFYGGLNDRGGYGFPKPIEHAPDINVPVLGLFGGGDQSIPQEDVDAFEAGLAEEHEIHVYPGAPHSFFDRSFAEWAGECDDAWRRVLGFLDRV